MQKFSAKEIRLRRKFIKEAINLRGFDMVYYSLDLEKSINTSEYSSFYKEAPQPLHFYNKFDIKGTIVTTQSDFLNKKYGLENIQTETTNLITAEIYYLTPQDKWASDFGEHTILPNEYEESGFYLKIEPKIGDYLRYPVGGNQFFEITSTFLSGYDFFETYILTLMQRPYIKSESDLSESITTPNVQDKNQKNPNNFE